MTVLLSHDGEGEGDAVLLWLSSHYGNIELAKWGAELVWLG